MPLRGRQFGRRGLAGAHLGVHAQVAHFAGDQVAILPAGVQDDDLWIGIQIPMVASSRAMASDANI